MTQTKERPILFSAPMVRAILAGEKTVTRRVIKPQPEVRMVDVIGPMLTFKNKRGGHWLYPNAREQVIADCPYGQVGDRLWVRETWGVISHDFDQQGNAVDWEPDRPAVAIREMRFGRGYYSGHVIYGADGPCEWAGDEDGGGEPRSAWKPSIHMPRRAGRILLEITSVRVERLQDISDEQCVAEGCGLGPAAIGMKLTVPPGASLPRAMFAEVWKSTNGASAWYANPWVWVVEFKRVMP